MLAQILFSLKQFKQSHSGSSYSKQLLAINRQGHWSFNIETELRTYLTFKYAAHQLLHTSQTLSGRQSFKSIIDVLSKSDPL